MRKIYGALAGIMILATMTLAQPAQACTTGPGCAHVDWDMYVTHWASSTFDNASLTAEYNGWFYDGPVNGSGFAKRWSRAVDAQDNVTNAAGSGNPFTMNYNLRNTTWDDSGVDWNTVFASKAFSGHTETSGPCATVPWGAGGSGTIAAKVYVGVTTSSGIPFGITDVCDNNNNGIIDHAVVVINTSVDWNLDNTQDTTRYDLEGAMTHEYTHLTGFGMPFESSFAPDANHWTDVSILAGYSIYCGSSIPGGASNVDTMCATFANFSQWYQARSLAHDDSEEFNEGY